MREPFGFWCGGIFSIAPFQRVPQCYLHILLLNLAPDVEEFYRRKKTLLITLFPPFAAPFYGQYSEFTERKRLLFLEIL